MIKLPLELYRNCWNLTTTNGRRRHSLYSGFILCWQEVTLRKCSSDEKLGLTVCYSSGSEADTCTEVYIRDIAPQSVADKDGRLRQGDQILQVSPVPIVPNLY